jgi:CRP-like cAMP-binding protein
MTQIYNLLTEKMNSPVLRKFKKGEVIYHEGDTPKNLYFLKVGLIGLFHISESGKESFLRIFSLTIYLDTDHFSLMNHIMRAVLL